MKVGQRKLLMAGLVSAFIVQTTLVYTDTTRQQFEPLSALAMQGRAVWHQNNCYTCHQIYGFGGFLGRDLTNFASRAFDSEELEEQLSDALAEGRLQMPVFDLPQTEIDALVAYFQNLDKTGIGQARATRVPPPYVVDAAVSKVAAQTPPAADVVAGQELFERQKCASCHLLLKVNADVYPDLTLAVGKFSDEEIDKTLEFGRPERGMVPTGFTAAERKKVIAWFHWLANHRPALLDELNLGKNQAAPWYEFGPSPNDETR